MFFGEETYGDVCRGDAVIGCLGDFLLHYFFVRVACVRQGLLPIFSYWIRISDLSVGGSRVVVCGLRRTTGLVARFGLVGFR